MKPKAKKALLASIEKWEKNLKVTHPDDALMGPNTCPLCKLYRGTYPINCCGCPIAYYLEDSGCDNSIYEAVAEAHEDWERWMYNNTDADGNVLGDAFSAEAARKKFVKATQKELAFLKSLLKKPI